MFVARGLLVAYLCNTWPCIRNFRRGFSNAICFGVEGPMSKVTGSGGCNVIMLSKKNHIARQSKWGQLEFR